MKLTRAIELILVGGARSRVKIHLSLLSWARRKDLVLVGKFIGARLQKKYGIYISHKAHVPSSTDFPHPIAVVIGEGVRLGENVTIYQNVTLGGARRGDWQAGNYPDVGADTVIFAGAVVVGKVRIGRGCIIGANAVVTKDVPDFATAVGVPAKVL